MTTSLLSNWDKKGADDEQLSSIKKVIGSSTWTEPLCPALSVMMTLVVTQSN